MPVEYFVDEVKDLLVTTVSGVVTNDDTVAYMEQLVGDPLYRSGMDGLVFTDAIERFEVTATAIEIATRIAVDAEQRFSGSRWAVIASQDLVFGMTRMFELSRDPESYEVRVFRESGPAIEWLQASASNTSAPLNRSA